MSQKSILSYFTRTPVSTSPGTGSGSSSTKNGTSTRQTPSPKTREHHSHGHKVPSSAPTTPTTTNSKSSKKRGTNERSPNEHVGNTTKRLKTDEVSPSKDQFFEGGLVWAKLEGYPFWPAMLRGEGVGSAIFRNDSNEYHVQFFDEPPSRAWVRKPDVKLFAGSADGRIPPAKGDPSWVKACRTADGAFKLSPAQRLEKYWFDFGPVEDEDGDGYNESFNLPSKSRSSKGNQSPSKKRRKVQVLSSDSDEDEFKQDKSSNEHTPVSTKSKKKINEAGKSKQSAITIADDDDEDEYKPSSADVTLESESENDGDSESSIATEEDSDIDEKIVKTKKKGVRTNNKTESITPQRNTPTTTPTSSKRVDFQNRLARFSTYDSPVSSPKQDAGKSSSSNDSWPHLKYSWLQPNKIMDKMRRRPDHPDYDPKTLYVPNDFLEKLTPGVRQWWELKSKHFDSILFFKLGKFYEMYHMDAVVGVQELGLIFMRGEFAHCGFPEIAYSHNASSLVAKGYKVIRVEQTETPDMMQERVKRMTRPSKFDKVVKREICQITTKGIRFASPQDPASMPFQAISEYLYAIVENPLQTGKTEIGVCFIDTTIGTFHIGQFIDDRNYSRLRTLFTHHIPVQILYEKGKINPATLGLLNNMGSVRKDALIPETEFWGPKKVLKFLAEGDYFKSGEDAIKWPDNFKIFLSQGDSLGLTPDPQWELGVRSLGGIVWYLKECLVEHDILTLGKFANYIPVDSQSSAVHDNSKETDISASRLMVLDGVTLKNLEITFGSRSLLMVIDKCSTQFGKRLLRYWICAPLASGSMIKERQDAVEELMELNEMISKVTIMMKSLLDLERLLNKIHTLGSLHRSKEHPDSRASFFDEKKYSRRKIYDLTNVLKNFKTCVSIINVVKKVKIQSSLLSRVISEFPSLTELLDFFDNAFDHEAAIKEGKIQPSAGVDEDYDAAFKAVEEIQMEADAYLKEVQKELKAKVSYFGSDKKRFQLEVSDTVRAPNKYEMSSSRKGFKRYTTSHSRELLAKLMAAEVNRENVVKDITRRVFAQFDKSREFWSKAVNCIGTLDALISLSTYSKSTDNMCRPKFVHSDQPFIKIDNGRHPCVAEENYIPNSISLGKEKDLVTKDGDEHGKGPFLLLTGANMGGKSTTMKQVGLITVLAHMGCYVPANDCTMTVVDRIFTRIGASDNIGGGESTFFIELSETSSILQHASPHSLVLMDELGRGTATYDGTAIAYSVAHALAYRQCRTIFSTHYHSLVDEVRMWEPVQLGHMACMVEREDEDDDDPTRENVTFLYKLTSGPCPKSYGFNAARLAGIPSDVIRRAHTKAKELEASVDKLKLLKTLRQKINGGEVTVADIIQGI